MPDYNVLWFDEKIDKGILGTDMTAQVMGSITPSVVSLLEQFIVPAQANNRGFIIKGGTYLRMSIPATGGGYTHWVFGSETDISIPYAEQRLDAGVSFTAGRDYYIYLCYQAPADDGSLPTADIVVSLNSTFPAGYDANTSRKIGGFHTLCAAVGTIAGHPLSGFNNADILPASFWDLRHRPTCQPEGMVYIKELDFWADIYLQSGSRANTKSAFAATTTDSQAYSQHIEDLFMVGKNPLSDEEFSCAAEGSNQKTNIVGSADPVTTGGHNDTAGRRMISNYGLEDCCGALYQWLSGWSYGSNQTAVYVADGTKGSVYQVNALLAGGHWSFGTNCGSRHRDANDSRLYVSANYGCRGRARSRATR